MVAEAGFIVFVTVTPFIVMQYFLLLKAHSDLFTIVVYLCSLFP